jgi:RNA polymerase sigma-70 factor, ECF subfamily
MAGTDDLALALAFFAALGEPPPTSPPASPTSPPASAASPPASPASLPAPPASLASPPASSASLLGELGAALGGAWRAGRLAWPALDVPAEAFVASLASRLPPPLRTAPAIRALHAADLYLVCACSRRDPRAITTFEKVHFPEVDRALGRMRLTPIADEVKGKLREKLFFPRDGERTPLASYSGRGGLGAWLRLVAVRAALKTLRANKNAPDDIDELDIALGGGDPELTYLKATFAAEFKSALAEAIEALSVRDRNLLRQHTLDGLTIDQLGALYRVHRATAARWVADVRARLLKAVQRQLMARLRLDEAELESVMRLARSQLDVSVRRLLQPKKGQGADSSNK